MSVTSKKIIKAIENYAKKEFDEYIKGNQEGDSPDSYEDHEDYTDLIADIIEELRYNKEFVIKDNNFIIKTKDTFGGMGKGDEYWIVLEVQDKTNNEVSFWQIPGWYSSYEGGELELESLYQVYPKEKTITIWCDSE